MPLRLVGRGNSSIVIRRVLLLIITGIGDDDGTQDPIELTITAGGNVVVQGPIVDTTQTDLDKGSHNWYFLDVLVPFTKTGVLSNGGIKLRIHGIDAWLPNELYVYGFDTAEGRPTEIVHLVSIRDWDMGPLSRDPNEGVPSVDLQMS
jgi:hypothetical protein